MSAKNLSCPYCDGTGDVHSIDGEWRGVCKPCVEAKDRLVDAAPDLLEALIHIEGAAMDITCPRSAIRDAARAAIAKAKGEQNA